MHDFLETAFKKYLLFVNSPAKARNLRNESSWSTIPSVSSTLASIDFSFEEDAFEEDTRTEIERYLQWSTRDRDLMPKMDGPLAWWQVRL